MKVGTLAMAADQHMRLKRFLFPSDKLETAAILLFKQGTGCDYKRLVLHEIIEIPPEQSSIRSADFLVWEFEKNLPNEKITEIDKQGLSLFTIHSHPSGYPCFSGTDDKSDQATLPAVCHWFDDNRPNGSAIMLPSGEIKARTVNSRGDFDDIETVISVGEEIAIWKNRKSAKKHSATLEKQQQTFGAGTTALLASMRVGVVGCSGTGSIIAELLARNGVGHLTLIDDDKIEERNLNRIINAQKKDVGKHKAEVLKATIVSMGLGTTAIACLHQTDSRDAAQAIVDCDVIFGCVDSLLGRYHLECLASAYYIPYFDVGVDLQADGKGGIERAMAVAHYVRPGVAGLLARRAYTSEDITAEVHKRNNPAYYEKQRIAGYLESIGEEQPAVMSINMQAACLAFNDFLARLHRFRRDDNRDFAIQRFMLIDAYYDYESAPANALQQNVFARWEGMADASLLVSNNISKCKNHRHLTPAPEITAPPRPFWALFAKIWASEFFAKWRKKQI